MFDIGIKDSMRRLVITGLRILKGEILHFSPEISITVLAVCTVQCTCVKYRMFSIRSIPFMDKNKH